MAGDKGFKAAEGVKGDDDMENERGKEGWSPESGETSEANRKAGDKAFDPSNAAPTEKGDSASARPADQ